jgi:hypothetical protein
MNLNVHIPRAQLALQLAAVYAHAHDLPQTIEWLEETRNQSNAAIKEARHLLKHPNDAPD